MSFGYLSGPSVPLYYWVWLVANELWGTVSNVFFLLPPREEVFSGPQFTPGISTVLRHGLRV